MNMLPLFIALPLGCAFVAPLLGRGGRAGERASDVLANLCMAALLAMSAGAVLAGRSVTYWMGDWSPVAGLPLGISLVLDGLTALLLLTVNLIGFAATLYSIAYMARFTDKARYYSLFLLMVAGMNGAVLTGDLFNLFVFVEIASIASYALVAFGCRHEELEASFRYVILGGAASTFVLFGVALLYAQTGALNMAYVARAVAGSGGPVATMAAALFVAGFGLKAALVPFHAWLPDAHPSAPAPISAMLSGVLIKAIGVYALVRVLFDVVGFTPAVSNVLLVLGALSMIGGVFLAVAQWDFKRLLAYHSISQIGYVVMAIGLGTPLGVAAGLFHLVNHAVFKSLLFLNAGAVEYRTGTRQLAKMGGLRDEMPLTAGTSLAASMSIAGVPPFNGFFSKLLIIIACVAAGRPGYAAWAVLVSLMTLASFAKVQKYAFFDPPAERPRAREAPAAMCAAMLLLAALCLGMGALWLPGVRAAVLEPAAEAVTAGPAGYAASALAQAGPGAPGSAEGGGGLYAAR